MLTYREHLKEVILRGLKASENHWYDNIGSCTNVVHCGKGNFQASSGSGPIYLDLDRDGKWDDFNYDGVPDDLRGKILVVPGDYNNAATYAGSLHFKRLRIREVIPGKKHVQSHGWGGS